MSWFGKQLGTSGPAPAGRGPQRPVQRPQEARPVSPDGLWEWDGEAWVSRSSLPAPPPPPPEDLPKHARRAKAVQGGEVACPRCEIDDTFLEQPNGRGRRCFSCGFTELATAYPAAYDPTPGVGQGAAPARNQSGGSWAGDKNITPPPQTRSY